MSIMKNTKDVLMHDYFYIGEWYILLFSQRRIDKVRYGTMYTGYCGELEGRGW